MRKRKYKPANEKTPVISKSISSAILLVDDYSNGRRTVFGGIFRRFAKNIKFVKLIRKYLHEAFSLYWPFAA